MNASLELGKYAPSQMNIGDGVVDMQKDRATAQ